MDYIFPHGIRVKENIQRKHKPSISIQNTERNKMQVQKQPPKDEHLSEYPIWYSYVSGH